MRDYILRRLLLVPPLLLGVTLITFLLSHSVPADPVSAHLGQSAMLDPAIVEAFRREWGLDRPLHEQYLAYLDNLRQGKLGRSIVSKRPVEQDLAQYLLEEARVAVVPGAAFGSYRHIRLSFATSEERLREGLNRMAEAMAKQE